MTIKQLIKAPVRLLQRIENKFVRFLFVGVINTMFGYGMFVLFIWFGMHYSVALLCANFLGILFNYKTTGYIVFETKSNRLLLHFFLVYGIVYLFNLGELWLLDASNLYETILSWDLMSFLDTLPLNKAKIGDAIGQAITLLPNAILSFLLNKVFVFKPKEQDGKGQK
ncbi:MAG: GtrA family protein [Bacteroidales bacterium]|nr:GtrA family protein [Bacteroidales bacterium]